MSLDCTLKMAQKQARRWWCTPVIPATQEAEIRRIVVQSQSGQVALETLSQKKKITKAGLVEWLK
jgi:hypothetical protein